MIDDLDNTLAELLKRELPASIVSQVSISFATPDNQFPPSSVSLPAIDLFLYDLQENRELRSNEWSFERLDDGTAVQRRPAVRVDCSFLITAWPSPGAHNPAQDEHRLLGEVLKVLLRHPTIPSAVLQGSLKAQEQAMPAITLQPGRLQSLGEFWQALGGKPKAALNYVVTLAVQPSAAQETAPLVTQKELGFTPV